MPRVPEKGVRFYFLYEEGCRFAQVLTDLGLPLPDAAGRHIATVMAKRTSADIIELGKLR